MRIPLLSALFHSITASPQLLLFSLAPLTMVPAISESPPSLCLSHKILNHPSFQHTKNVPVMSLIFFLPFSHYTTCNPQRSYLKSLNLFPFLCFFLKLKDCCSGSSYFESMIIGIYKRVSASVGCYGYS